MSEQQSGGVAAATTVEAPSLLKQILAATKQTEPDRAEELVKTFVEVALAKTTTFDKNFTRTINKVVDRIDGLLSVQLDEIMHHPRFQQLEGSWRGLDHLVKNTNTSSNLKLKVLNVSKREISRDLGRAVEFDQSLLFKTVYENGFGIAGGEPFGALIGDYEWGVTPDEVETLSLVAGIAASAFAPFISAAAPSMLGLSSWTGLDRPRDLAKIFDTTEYTKWRAFRDTDDARFVSLVLPRVMARLPYGSATKPIEEFKYEEAPLSEKGESLELPHDQYCWMNAAYALGTRLTAAFEEYGFCTAIRGVEAGGKVGNLKLHNFLSADGDRRNKCPIEANLTERRANELSGVGFMAMEHHVNTDFAVFNGGQTVHRPKRYDSDDASANAQISARLPYVMATSRFAHYLKVMARDKIGSSMEAAACETWLNTWIKEWVNSLPGGSDEMKLRKPLREARVQVEEVPGQAGVYNAVAYLRPWLQMEELTASLRMVAKIPQRSR